MSVSGVNPNAINPNQSQIQQSNIMQDLQSVVTLMQDLINTTDELSQLAGGMKQVKGESKTDSHTAQLKAQTSKPEFMPSGAEAMAANAVGVEEEEKIKLKKRKKQQEKLEQLLAKLSQLEGAFNMQQLTEEEQQTVQAFFKNMGSIKQLKKELQLLMDQEAHLQNIIDTNQAAGA